MGAALTVTFRHLPHSGALEAAAREVGQCLQRLNDRMTGCHIVLVGEGESHEAIRTCLVKIHVSVPGAQIHAECRASHSEGGGDSRRALRTASDNVKRQLKRLNLSRAEHRPSAP